MIYKSGVGHDRLEDLIAGVTPTLNSWTNNPTDAADITDGDISTFCTTGDKVDGVGWQEAGFEWDLGAFYNVLVSGVGAIGVTAGTPRSKLYLYDGAAWIQCQSDMIGYTSSQRCGTVYGGVCSKVRFNIMSDAAATVTPNIREFHVWRLR